MQRYKTYDAPHKGLRNALSQLSLMAGHTDYAVPEEVAELHRLGSRVFGILTMHAQDETSVTLAHLETRCAGCSRHDAEDHEQIHLMQQGLEDQLNAINTGTTNKKNMTEAGDEFYLAFSEFHGRYLEHIAEEERVTQLLLWQHFTDEELHAHRGEVMAGMPPPTLLIWFEFIIPAQTRAERIALLTGFKQLAPPAFFAEGMAVVQKVLPAPQYEQLETTLK
jgi:hypothetical protein